MGALVRKYKHNVSARFTALAIVLVAVTVVASVMAQTQSASINLTAKSTASTYPNVPSLTRCESRPEYDFACSGYYAYACKNTTDKVCDYNGWKVCIPEQDACTDFEATGTPPLAPPAQPSTTGSYVVTVTPNPGLRTSCTNAPGQTSPAASCVASLPSSCVTASDTVCTLSFSGENYKVCVPQGASCSSYSLSSTPVTTTPTGTPPTGGTPPPTGGTTGVPSPGTTPDANLYLAATVTCTKGGVSEVNTGLDGCDVDETITCPTGFNYVCTMNDVEPSKTCLSDTTYAVQVPNITCSAYVPPSTGGTTPPTGGNTGGEVTPPGPVPMPGPSTYACFNRATNQCVQQEGGIYSSEAECKASCTAELPAQVIKDEVSCRRYYRALRSDVKTQRVLYTARRGDVDPETRDLIDEYIAMAKDLESALKQPKCDVTTREVYFNTITDRLDVLDEKIIELEDTGFILEEDGEEIVLTEIIIQKAQEAGFQESLLNDRLITRVINTLLSTPQLTVTHVQDIRGGVENIQYFKANHQEEIVQTKLTILSKLDRIDEALTARNVSAAEKDTFMQSFKGCLKTNWGNTVGSTIASKFNQITTDVSRGEELSRIEADIAGFCGTKKESNNVDLCAKGYTKFCDVDNDTWYFSVFENPKQVAFKGNGSFVFPKEALKAAEAILAIGRTLQLGLLEPNECDSPLVPPGIKDVPEWARCSLETVTNIVNPVELRVTGVSMNEATTRERFALWIWKLANQSLTKANLQQPTASDVAATSAAFADCSAFALDDAVMEAITGLKVNNIMVGKAPDEFGCGDSLLRAEAAKVMLLLQEFLPK